jgi:hypothetical protein
VFVLDVQEAILSADIKRKLHEAAQEQQLMQSSSNLAGKPSPTAKSLPKSLEAVTSEHIAGDGQVAAKSRLSVLVKAVDAPDRNAIDPTMVPVMISAWKPGRMLAFSEFKLFPDGICCWSCVLAYFRSFQ